MSLKYSKTGINKILIFLLVICVILLYSPSRTFADLTTEWIPTTSLPYLLASHTVFSFNNSIFIIDGSSLGGHSHNEVLSTTPENNGSISTWSSNSTQTPSALIYHSTTTKDNKVYVLGGREENAGSALGSVNKVYLGLINDHNIISSWQTLTPLPTTSQLGSAVVIGNKLYYAGGIASSNGPRIQNIYVADINTDGTIGEWTIAGLLPEPMQDFSMVVNGKNIYIIGGIGNNTGLSSKTYKTTVQENGSIAAWEEVSSLPQPLRREGAIRVGSTIYVVGGYNSDALDTVYYTNINEDGTITPWKESEYHLPVGSCCGGVAAVNNYLYVIGGYRNDGYLNTVFYAKLSDISGSGNLDVPYFSQNAPKWGGSEYDHAQLVGLPNPTMDRWGCAVTSAAMVLRYHHIDEFANGTEIDPGSLNEWLKNNHGYVYGTGTDGAYSAFNWLSIPDLTKQLYKEGKAPVKLTHKRVKVSDAYATLTHDITIGNDFGKYPDIVQVANKQTTSHFVVVKGQTNNSFAINDPEWNYPDLTSFNSPILQMDSYVPSHTDFSYISLIVNPSVNMLVTDSNGHKTGKIFQNGILQEYNEIPNASYNYEAPISNPDENGDLEKLGTGVNEFMLPTPANGTYTITLSSAKNDEYTLNEETVEINGDNQFNTTAGILGANGTTSFTLSYLNNATSVYQKAVSIQSTIDDVKALYALKEITTGYVENDFINRLESAQKNADNSLAISESAKLHSLNTLISVDNATGTVSNYAKQILINNLTTILTSL